MSNGKKIDLEFPLTIDGKEMKELYLRRPTLKDFLGIQGLQDTEADTQMLAKLSGVNAPDLEALDLKDYNVAQTVISSFLD